MIVRCPTRRRETPDEGTSQLHNPSASRGQRRQNEDHALCPAKFLLEPQSSGYCGARRKAAGFHHLAEKTWPWWAPLWLWLTLDMLSLYHDLRWVLSDTRAILLGTILSRWIETKIWNFRIFWPYWKLSAGPGGSVLTVSSVDRTKRLITHRKIRENHSVFW